MVVIVFGLSLAPDPDPVRLVGTFPADGEVLAAAPAAAAVTFSRPVDPVRVHLSVSPAEGGPVVSTGAPQLVGEDVTVGLSIVRPGTYLLAYHVLLPDGREQTGVRRFVVAGMDGVAPTIGADRDEVPVPGHHHVGDDLFSRGLLVLDGVLILVVLALILRRPRPVGRRPRSPVRTPGSWRRDSEAPPGA